MAISMRESITVGFSDFWSRKVRSLVTIMGIVLGAMSIMVVLSLISAVKKQTMAWIEERGGINRLSVDRNWEFRDDEHYRTWFSDSEIEFIRSKLPEDIYFNAAMYNWGRPVFTYEDKQTNGRYIGVMADNEKIENWGVYPGGRFISDYDVQQSADVCCIGTNIRDELFGNKDPIGEWISVSGRRMQVIGVMTHRFMKPSGDISVENALDWMNSQIFVPVTTMLHKIPKRWERHIDTFEIKTQSVEQLREIKTILEDLLMNMRQNQEVFHVWSAEEQAQELGQNTRIFGIIFFVISAISMLVGGIVIMNIMLATIQERTREIGVRLAVGARRLDIFMQFMVQTVLITTLGGLIGVAVGTSILDFVGQWLKMETTATPVMVAIAVTISAGVGLVFGILPAIHASNLNPVKALRYE